MDFFTSRKLWYLLIGSALTMACAVIPGAQAALPWVAGLAGSAIVGQAAKDVANAKGKNRDTEDRNGK